MADHSSYDDWVQVAEASQVYEAELIALRLRSNGLEVQIVDQTFRQEPLPNVRNFAVVRVLVARGREDEARRILAESRPLPDDADASDGRPEEK
jgi:putative signal transducing protein